MSERIEVIEDGWVVVVTTVEGHRVRFDVWEADHLGEDGTPFFWRRESSTNADATSDRALGERYLTGAIKWDGCADIEMSPDRDGYVHTCGRDDFARLSRVRAWLWVQAVEEFPDIDE